MNILLNLDTGHSQGLDESQNKISGNGPPHQPSSVTKSSSALSHASRGRCDRPVIVTQNTGGDEEAAGVRPGDRLVLGPPPSDHNTENENIFLVHVQSNNIL